MSEQCSITPFKAGGRGVASYPVPISIPTSAREGNRAWQHWGVHAVDIRDVTIHVTLDQFGSNIATQLLNRATDEALEGDHVQL